MAQKINPVSTRFGSIRLWNLILQNYGKSTYNFAFYKGLQFRSIINRTFASSHLILVGKELWFYNNEFFLNIHFIDKTTKHPKFYPFLFDNILKVFFKWPAMKAYSRIYMRTNQVLTSKLLTNYGKYLSRSSTNFNKILWKLHQFSENHLNERKIIYSKKGLRFIYLKGFKIRLVGRFNNSRSQMTKNIQQDLGLQSLASLKNYVEFSQDEIYTKSGSCGLQVWLFYGLS